jgi:hypothetical protein
LRLNWPPGWRWKACGSSSRFSKVQEFFALQLRQFGLQL